MACSSGFWENQEQGHGSGGGEPELKATLPSGPAAAWPRGRPALRLRWLPCGLGRDRATGGVMVCTSEVRGEHSARGPQGTCLSWPAACVLREAGRCSLAGGSPAPPPPHARPACL